jgi:hypothetical protein
MGKIVISENVTLDGVVEDPTGDEGFTLIAHDLVDERRLMIYPVVLGVGARLFAEASDKKSPRLVDIRTVDDLAYLTYQPARDA